MLDPRHILSIKCTHGGASGGGGDGEFAEELRELVATDKRFERERQSDGGQGRARAVAAAAAAAGGGINGPEDVAAPVRGGPAGSVLVLRGDAARGADSG